MARRGKRKAGGTAKRRFAYPAEQSIGHQVRWTHRALQRELEARIRPYGITLGMWGFLRALWEKDGLSQRELSERVGTTEPTTVTALHAMEKRGLVVRVQNTDDRRKSNIYLTQPARALRELLLPTAREVNRAATGTISHAEIEALKRILTKIRANLAAAGAARTAPAREAKGLTPPGTVSK
ncbi:MAG TPA: MarR family transcriptional regulator [Stellaceae bacterium]|jgi:DNA-binding MarR family transcriptional regulator|nr:MarR family transcriptional regulator [Stellaceae bacterium]